MRKAHAARARGRILARGAVGAQPQPTPETVSLAHLKLHGVGHVKPDPTVTWPLHQHLHNELVICFGGILHVRVGDRELRATAGDVLYYTAGLEHEERSDPDHPAETRWLAFTLSDDLSRAPLFARDVSGRLRQLILWVHDEQFYPPGRTGRICLQFTRALVVEWLRVCGIRDPQMLQRLRAFVERNLTGPLSLEELAANAGMSKYHYLRTYKQSVGRTPMEDVRALRLREAQHLLLTTELSTKEVAARCGFSDQYHMGRLFRRLLAVTPGELRATLRLGGREPAPSKPVTP